MNRKLLLYFILSISFLAHGSSQEVDVTSRYEGHDIIYDVAFNGYGTYTLVLSFTELRGYKSPLGRQAIINITPFSGNSIYKLTAIEGHRSPICRSSYQYYQGKYNAKPDANFPYLLPVKAGEKTKALQFENIEVKLGKSSTDKVLGVVFNYAATDTVYTIRSGQIVHIEGNTNNRIKTGEGTVLYDEPSRIIIEVEHKDGTIARYVCISSGKSLLEVGDRVIAGQPIAVLAQGNEDRRIGISLMHLGKDLEYKIFIPRFYTSNGLMLLQFEKEYMGASTKEIIGKELTKKEKKSLSL